MFLFARLTICGTSLRKGERESIHREVKGACAFSRCLVATLVLFIAPRVLQLVRASGCCCFPQVLPDYERQPGHHHQGVHHANRLHLGLPGPHEMTRPFFVRSIDFASPPGQETRRAPTHINYPTRSSTNTADRRRAFVSVTHCTLVVWWMPLPAVAPMRVAMYLSCLRLLRDCNGAIFRKFDDGRGGRALGGGRRHHVIRSFYSSSSYVPRSPGTCLGAPAALLLWLGLCSSRGTLWMYCVSRPVEELPGQIIQTKTRAQSSFASAGSRCCRI